MRGQASLVRSLQRCFPLTRFGLSITNPYSRRRVRLVGEPRCIQTSSEQSPRGSVAALTFSLASAATRNIWGIWGDAGERVTDGGADCSRSGSCQRRCRTGLRSGSKESLRSSKTRPPTRAVSRKEHRTRIRGSWRKMPRFVRIRRRATRRSGMVFRRCTGLPSAAPARPFRTVRSRLLRRTEEPPRSQACAKLVDLL